MFNPIEYVRQKIKDYNSDIDTRPSSAIYELVILPLAALSSAIQYEISYLYQSRAIANAEYMTNDEFDLLMSNLFITRHDGEKASGIVYYYFSVPTGVMVPEGAIVETEEGYQFIVTEDTTITEGAMSLNREMGMYYMSAKIEAADYGEEYNVIPGEITKSVFSISGLIKVSNPLVITGGLTMETNVQQAERSKTAIAARNLLTNRSIRTVLREDFQTIKGIEIAGFGDAEMLRDTQTVLVNGTEYNMHLGGCVDIYCNTGILSEVTINVEASQYIPASIVRAEGRRGVFTSGTDPLYPGVRSFIDSEADFIASAVESGDKLTVFNDLANGDYVVDGEVYTSLVNTVNEAASTGNNLSYKISRTDDFKSPMVAIKEIVAADDSTLTDGLSFDVEPVTIIDEGLVFDVCTSGNIPYIATLNEGNVYLKVLEQDFVSTNGSIEVSATGTCSDVSIFAVNPAMIAVSWIDSGVVYMTTVDVINETVEVPVAAFTSDASNTFLNPKALADSEYIYVLCHDYDIAGDSYTCKISKYDLTLASTISNATIGDMGGSGMPQLLACHISSSHIALASVGDGSNVEVAALNFDETHLGTIYNEASVAISSLTAGINDDDNIVVSWVSENKYLKFFKAPAGTWDSGTSGQMALASEVMRSQGSCIDSSSGIHFAFIDENDNSGDAKYIKINQVMDKLISEEVINDQYRNSSLITMNVDASRRPIIMWSSFDLVASRIDGCRKESHDYFLKPSNTDTRFSEEEIVAINVDPEYDGTALSVTYYYPENMSPISSFVSDRASIDRVVVSDYLVKNPVPCLIDITMTYSGDDDGAVEKITDYINNLDSSELYASDLMAILDLSVSERVEVPFNMTAYLSNTDGSISVTKSNNGFSFNRTVRFIPRNIEVL